MKFIIKQFSRSGKLPLRAAVSPLGEGKHGSGGSGYRSDWSEGVVVKIWACRGGGYLVTWSRWNWREGEGDSYDVSRRPDAAAVVKALLDGGFGEAEAEALKTAAAVDEALAAVAVEDLAKEI